ncbi:MAG: DUF4834 family protein [Bacteroidaceae bacterium]|nr:DUF4834 family protein [Bacteroidaceae bacterium]
MHFFGCLFFVIIGVFLLFIIGIMSFIQKIFQVFGFNLPWFKTYKTENFNYSKDNTDNEKGSQNNTIYSTEEFIKKKKIYTEEDGEYVEFEEIKEGNSTP